MKTRSAPPDSQATASQHAVAQQYRAFLLATAGALYLLTPLELWFIEHVGDTLQLVPFLLSGLGIASAAWMYRRPGRHSLLAVRGTALVVVLGSLYGMYAHFEHNLAFEREIRPGGGMAEALWESLGGASPPLAPGILILAAVLAAAATYRHPRG